MKNFNKWVIILISFTFIASGMHAQGDLSPKLKDQMEVKVKPSTNIESLNYNHSTAPILTAEELIQQRIQNQEPVFSVMENVPDGSQGIDDFCAPVYTYGCQYGDEFTSFAVEQIQNMNSGCANTTGVSGWSTYFNLGPAILMPGFTHTFSMVTSFSNQYVNIWIDYNDDEILTANEIILQDFYLASSGITYTVDVTIPANATPGQHKMRAMMVYASTFTDPCGSYSYGEAEDYTVIIGVPAYGTLEGTVTENTGGAPVQGALVSVANGLFTATTAANGFYQISNVLVGTWDVDVTKTGYNPASATVTITENITTTQNFALTAPTMNITPATINVTVDPYGTATQSVTINNNGDGPLGWNASVEYLTDGKTGSNPLKGSQAYAVQVYPSPNSVVTFDTDNPGTFTTISSTNLDPFAGDFSILSNTLMYVITYTNSTLYSIDINTGTETMIAPVTGITAGHNISGMACDKTTGIMYVSSTDISASDIYTVNLNTGALTMVGTTGIQGIIEIAIDGTGTMYAWDIVTDQSFTVDKTTGASTLLGALGFDLNYAQGGNWDPVSDIIYLAAYSTSGQLMTLDKTTGGLTLIGSFPGGAEVDALSFPGAAENWLTITPSSGTINAGGNFQMTVNFDALDFVAGTVKTANINFSSNPAVGTFTIPVSMTVGSLQFGHITGNITLSGSLPYNIGDVTQVLVQAGPYSAYPNAAGFYDIAAYPGTYDVTATLYGYTEQATAGVVVTENIITPNVNFTMPCINGIIEGTVTALTGGTPIAGATVSLLGTDFTTTTAANGTYQFIVEAGTYDVKVSASGYAAQTSTGVVVGIQSTVTQNFVLEDLAGIIVIIDLDPTPNTALTSVIEGFFPGGLVVYTTSATGYPLDQDVQTVFLLLGIYANNHVLTTAEANVIKTWIDTYPGRNLYMEGGDTWAFDTQTPLHPYFNINPIADGSGDLMQVDGIASFWDGFNWSYNGENNWIDHIAAIPPAINVLENPTANYYCGVAYDEGTYKTVGASFELTGLNDGTGFSMGVACIMGWFGYPVFAYGTLEGTVTEAGTGNPVDGATITVGAVGTGTTLANGTYSIPNILTGNWTVTCSKDGYNTVTAPVTIIENQTTTQNFILTAPGMVVNPLVVNEELEMGETADVLVNISNTGTGELSWNASLVILTNTSPEDTWDLQMSLDLEQATGALGNAGSECDGTYFYSTRWATNLIHRFDLSGNLVEEFSIPGVNGLRDLAFDGTYMYGGAAATTIYEMDFVNKTLIGTINSPQQVRSIAYDEASDAFWCANWATDITLVSKSGTSLGSFPAAVHGLAGIYGTAYDNWTAGGPYLWIFDQGSGAGLPQLIHQANLGTTTMTGFSYDVLTDLGPNASAIAGGLFTVPNIFAGTVTIGGLLQGTPDVLFCYELAPYSTWISISPTSGTLAPATNQDMTVHLDATDIFIPGVYEAEIHFSSTPNVGTYVVDVTMTVGGLIPPVNLVVSHSCTDVNLVWEMPTGGNPDSWNVYRDGAMVGNTTGMTYTDPMMMPQQEYCYHITAVYAGDESMPTQPGCITVPMPSNLKPLNPEAQFQGGGNVLVTWDQPSACLTPDEYNVYRDGSMIGTTEELEYLDEGLSSGFYEYYIKAVYYFGESENSNPAYVLVGIHELSGEQFRLFPNPASSTVYIKSDQNVQTVEILNNAGQLVEIHDINATQFQVNIRQLERGLYYFKLITAEGTTLRKVLVD
ncbi:MAG: carboxypeptidase regulatory-like domain-containing protein [Bacteroidales bacterium]